MTVSILQTSVKIVHVFVFFIVICSKKLHPTQNALCDADAASEATLGKGEPFKLAHCANRVTVEEASVITNQIMNIEEFIRTRIR